MEADEPLDYYAKKEGVLSYSIAKHVLTSGIQYQHWLHSEDKETDALRLGKAIDLAFLTPEEYFSSVAVAPECDRRTKAGKDAWAEFLSSSTGKLTLSAQEAETIARMADSLRLPCHAGVRALLDGEKQREFHWLDPCYGVECKARLDNVADMFGDTLIVDLKSTIDTPTKSTWANVVRRYDYQIQAAAYFTAMEAAGTPAHAFAWVCAEKKPPYHWAAWFCRPADVQYGFERWRLALELMAEWKKQGSYPSIAGGELY